MMQALKKIVSQKTTRMGILAALMFQLIFGIVWMTGRWCATSMMLTTPAWPIRRTVVRAICHPVRHIITGISTAIST